MDFINVLVISIVTVRTDYIVIVMVSVHVHQHNTGLVQHAVRNLSNFLQLILYY